MTNARNPSASRASDERFFGSVDFGLGCRFRLGGDADLQRIDPDRPFDVLELSLAEIRDRHVEPTAHLPVGVLGQANRARLGDSLQPRGDVDAVAHQVAVALLDDVAQMNADAKFDALVGRDPRVALDHGVLHFERAAHRVDDAAELDDAAIAGALDDAAMMHGDCGIYQIAAQRAQSRQSSIFVRASEPAITTTPRRSLTIGDLITLPARSGRSRKDN